MGWKEEIGKSGKAERTECWRYKQTHIHNDEVKNEKTYIKRMMMMRSRDTHTENDRYSKVQKTDRYIDTGRMDDSRKNLVGWTGLYMIL